MSNPPRTCTWCGRSFTAKRSDAIGCSRSCRRHLEKAAKAAVMPTPAVVHETPLVETPDGLEGGWRRVGRYVILPADSRLTVLADPDALRRR
jgi:hypothetical protein